MKKNIFPALILTGFCILLLAVIYPLMVWGIAQFTPDKGIGETVTVNNKRHYANVGQKFTQDNYFWSRPSAVDYNAAGSGGSNKGATNPEYLKVVEDRIDTFLVHNPGVKKSEIPVDLVTASSSGLDPHISVASAKIQVKRVAQQRGLSEDKLNDLIANQTDKAFLGMFGPEKVNVLLLNIELDKLK